jgi:predicted SprT family Zn-dependent metalloprotease
MLSAGLGRRVLSLFVTTPTPAPAAPVHRRRARTRRPTDRSLQARFRQLNRELFEGRLPALPVRLEAGLGSCLGKAYYVIERSGRLRPTRISLKQEHPWTERFLRKVLVHEMVHAWAYLTHGETGHGRQFWKKMASLGYPRGHSWRDAGQHERDVW